MKTSSLLTGALVFAWRTPRLPNRIHRGRVFNVPEIS